MVKNLLRITVFMTMVTALYGQKPLTDYVNPFLGTAPLTNSKEIGYRPPAGWRVWAGLTYPGSSVPNAMVQLSPITEFGSGAGYEYEDTVIYAFTHTNKGHWNLCHIPVLPVTGEISDRDFGSHYTHENEEASPGYYRVLLDRYNINAELTSTLHCGYHKYTFPAGAEMKILFNLAASNERVRDWEINQQGDFAISGRQRTGGNIYFYATTSHKVTGIDKLGDKRWSPSVVKFESSDKPLEMKIALSFVSVENAKANLEAELTGMSFDQTREQAQKTWEKLLGKIEVNGGSHREKELFYSCLYRSFLWPALRSDVNGDFTDASGQVVNKGFKYYTTPSIWDTYRNKLVLLCMLEPEVTADVIQSMIDIGEKRGFMPTFFHGDHAAAFVSGSYLRGLRGFDVQSAYNLLLRNATVEGGTRPHIKEYIEKGYISTPKIDNPHVETKAKAGVTKTLEYAYDDYCVAQLAKALGDEQNYDMLMKRSSYYKNLFDPSTGLMRGKLDDGSWVENFNPQYPYYEYMYREANAWQSTFFAPHDSKGLINLFPNAELFEQQMDKFFTIPWDRKHIARNVSSFIGQYCHGNQPDHGAQYLYYFIGKQPKAQKVMNKIMRDLYGMGKEGNALCGMDDAGEMSSWYVFSAIGLYPYSPGDADYIVSVPLFDETKIQMSNSNTCKVIKKNNSPEITSISCGNETVTDFFISYQNMLDGNNIVITTR